MPDNEEEEKPEASRVTDIIGEFECYQKSVFVVALLVFLLSGWQGIQVTFLAPPVDFWCQEPFSSAHLYELGVNDSKPLGRDNILHCEVEELEDGVCRFWNYSRVDFKYTITEKLNLVCEKSWLVSFSSTLYMLGGSLGNILFGMVADRYGRRFTVIALTFPHVIGSFCIIYSPFYAVFAVGQFLSGMAVLGLESLSNVLLMEVVGQRYRSFLSTLLSFSFISGQMCVVGIAWITRDWFYIQLIIVFLALILFTSVWFLIESPTWLIVKGKGEEAKEAARKINKRNRLDQKTFDARMMILDDVLIHHKPSQKKAYTALDLFKTPKIRRWTIVLLLYWFVRSGAHYGISLNIHLFGKNVFFNYFLSTVFVYIAIIFCMFGMKYLGRKFTMIWFMISLGLSCFIYPLAQGNATVRIISVILGKFFAAGSVTVARTYTAEMLPTAVRSVGTGLGGLCGRMGSAMSPFTKELGEMTHEDVPMSVFAILSIISGVLVLFLPETKGQPLPQTIEEAEGMPPALKRVDTTPKLTRFTSSSDFYTDYF